MDDVQPSSEREQLRVCTAPHSVLVDGTPHHIKDVRLVQGAEATYCSSASSEDEAPMLYLPREDPAASESDHSDRGQHGPGDTT